MDCGDAAFAHAEDFQTQDASRKGREGREGKKLCVLRVLCVRHILGLSKAASPLRSAAALHNAPDRRTLTNLLNTAVKLSSASGFSPAMAWIAGTWGWLNRGWVRLVNGCIFNRRWFSNQQRLAKQESRKVFYENELCPAYGPRVGVRTGLHSRLRASLGGGGAAAHRRRAHAAARARGAGRTNDSAIARHRARRARARKPTGGRRR